MALKVVQQLVCKECGRPIVPRQGVIVHGNIYMVDDDVNSRGGLVGNNFPIDARCPTFSMDDVGETAYHIDCLLGIIKEAQEGYAYAKGS